MFLFYKWRHVRRLCKRVLGRVIDAIFRQEKMLIVGDMNVIVYMMRVLQMELNGVDSSFAAVILR